MTIWYEAIQRCSCCGRITTIYNKPIDKLPNKCSKCNNWPLEVREYRAWTDTGKHFVIFGGC